MNTLEFQQLLAAIMTQNVLLAKATVKMPGGGQMNENDALKYVNALYVTVLATAQSIPVGP